MRRFATRAVIYGLLAIAILVVWRKLYPRNPYAIPAFGGRVLSIRLPEGEMHFLQNDSRWSADKIGATQETLGHVGCTVCSVAMAVNGLGEHTTPKELNAMLSNAQGYTHDGWLVWSKLAAVFGNRVEAIVSDRPSHADMDRALERGEYPIVKFFLYGIVPHWVVVIGKEGNEYLVRDPLENATKPLRLSEQTDSIHSVRYVRRPTPAPAP